MRSPQEVRVANREQHLRWHQLKQTAMTDWDRAVLKDAAETLQLKKYWVLHPSWMYQVCAPFWSGEIGTWALNQQLHFGDLPLPPLPAAITLPPQFVAVKFYARHTFPSGGQTQQFAEQTVRQIAQRYPVVILGAVGHYDDHHDFPIPHIPNVTRLASPVPETNLLWQSAILARSLGFVGTYGGLAQLALRFKRPTISFFWEWSGTAFAHRALSEQLAVAMGTSFQVLRVLDLPVIQSVLPQIVVQTPSESQLVSA